MNSNKMKYSLIDQEGSKETEDNVPVYKGAKKFPQEIKPVPC
jgi:hypothetical protein